MHIIQEINFYNFNKNVGVVEVLIKDKFEIIKNKLNEFTVEDNSLPKDSWQTLYMEQYFSADRKIKLCKIFEEPADNIKDFNLVFFIYYLAKGQILQTPFGNMMITELRELPQEYKKSLEFEEVD